MKLLIAIISVAVATRIYTRSDTGTAFVESGVNASFYQDTVQARINVEIYSPRIMLDYKQYQKCDETYHIDGTPLCKHQFDGFDLDVLGFLNLGLTQQRKEILNRLNVSHEYDNNYEQAKHDAIEQLKQRVAQVESSAQITNRDRRSGISRRKPDPERAQWEALVEHLVSECDYILTRLCEIIQYRNDSISSNCTNLHYLENEYVEQIITADREQREDLKTQFQTWYLAWAQRLTIESNKIANSYNALVDFFVPARKEKRLHTVKEMNQLILILLANVDLVHYSTFDVTINHSKTKDELTKIRSRRSPAAYAAGAAVISVGSAIGGYFIGQSSTEIAMEEFREDIDKQKSAILGLSQSVKLNQENLKMVAKLLEKQPNIVLTGEASLPFDVRYESSLIKQGKLDTRYDIDKSLHISRLNSEELHKFQNYILTLQNSRLPLDKTFLLALRAECMSLQIQKLGKRLQFCNELAFHASRWDSGLNFQGVGLTYLDKAETMIRSIIYSFEVDIPVLYEDNLEHFQLINLGTFISSDVIKTISLPSDAVVTKSGIIHPFKKDLCTSLSSTLVCPTEAINTFDPCLHAVYNGTLSPDCEAQKSPSQSTCVSKVMENYAIVSMTQTSTIHYGLQRNRHMHEMGMVKSFDVVNRTTQNGVIFCERPQANHVPPEIQIPRRKVSTTANYTLSIIHKSNEHMIRVDTAKDKLRRLQIDIDNQSIALQKSTKILEENQYNTNSTMQVFKKKVSKAFNNIPSEIKDQLMKVVLPIMVPFAAIAGITFIILIALSIAVKCLRKSITNNASFRVPSQELQPIIQDNSKTNEVDV